MKDGAIVRKIEQEENVRKFNYYLRGYNDMLRWGVRTNYPDEVYRRDQALRENLNGIIDLLLLDSKTQNIEVLEQAFRLAYEHCCIHSHDGNLDSTAMIDLVDDFEEFYLSFVSKQR